jgi:hypothetical protein
MQTLILNPPVTTPAEPPAGAFVLAAALAGQGRDVALLDLSLELYHQQLDSALDRGPHAGSSSSETRRNRTLGRAIERLLHSPGGYDPQVHSSDLGHLHNTLGEFGAANPGWKLTLMDLTPGVRVTAPAILAAWMSQRPSPFRELWERILDPVLDSERPSRVAVSISYLSQLAASIDLVEHLRRRGASLVVGGSLIRSLASTGQGLELLVPLLGPIDPGDGSSLLMTAAGHSMSGDAALLLSRLAWPRLLSSRPYLASRPVVPVPLSLGCYWRRCLFCPDRVLPFRRVELGAIQGLLDSLPADLRQRRPLLHLLDSALPPSQLAAALPLLKEHEVGFYGFARPTKEWLAGKILEDCAGAGGLMLQLGIEGGSRPLLDRYHKGLCPEEAEQVVRETAAARIRTYLYLLFGLPGETDDDRKLTLAMLERLGEARAMDFLNMSLFNLPAQSELAARASENGITLLANPSGRAEAGEPDEKDLRLYRAFAVEGCDPRMEARRFLARSLPSYPASNEARGRTPRWLRAAHLALMQRPERLTPGP